MIQPTAITDDYRIEIEFDATPWFEQATEDAIADIAGCAQGNGTWGGGYPSDNVVMVLSDSDKRLDDLLRYCEITNEWSSDGVGFECYVDAHDAEEWIRCHRPHIVLAGANTLLEENSDD